MSRPGSSMMMGPMMGMYMNSSRPGSRTGSRPASGIVIYCISLDMKMHNNKIKTIFVCKEMANARANKTGFNIMIQF